MFEAAERRLLLRRYGHSKSLIDVFGESDEVG